MGDEGEDGDDTNDDADEAVRFIIGICCVILMIFLQKHKLRGRVSALYEVDEHA